MATPERPENIRLAIILGLQKNKNKYGVPMRLRVILKRTRKDVRHRPHLQDCGPRGLRQTVGMRTTAHESGAGFLFLLHQLRSVCFCVFFFGFTDWDG